ncbi:MAG: NUDIX domain-containing protein [Spirochaetales bacterium]|nr:NUDIX domain-containing protein [Spirochaetales bacterium]
MIEYLPLVDKDGNVIGKAKRSECHGNPSLVHPVVHLHVFGSDGRLLLQRRSASKDLLPGMWDTAVGGHVALGEDAPRALVREAREELGIRAENARFLYNYFWRTGVESEFVSAFLLENDGPFRIDPDEVAETRFFSKPEIIGSLAKGIFTPNFEEEFRRLTGDGIF